ncbi:hypothetical protein H696_01670 [Fonticula alba]|uniref:Uncharacterized protein n=1 Tax=Fonticula alba TaxID=691883 RepID=A0A058ZEC5_FONAL|nr:hypothetical protein H696_01670 [Fonticula alba]KCV72273.1 hypothetical protein H696_01670 [Fonticula alba]|eukprot:XP_009493851.1 hypothetical protein H696_01670 [Fonticula alba]
MGLSSASPPPPPPPPERIARGHVAAVTAAVLSPLPSLPYLFSGDAAGALRATHIHTYRSVHLTSVGELMRPLLADPERAVPTSLKNVDTSQSHGHFAVLGIGLAGLQLAIQTRFGDLLFLQLSDRLLAIGGDASTVASAGGPLMPLLPTAGSELDLLLPERLLAAAYILPNVSSLSGGLAAASFACPTNGASRARCILPSDVDGREAGPTGRPESDRVLHVKVIEWTAPNGRLLAEPAATLPELGLLEPQLAGALTVTAVAPGEAAPPEAAPRPAANISPAFAQLLQHAPLTSPSGPGSMRPIALAPSGRDPVPLPGAPVGLIEADLFFELSSGAGPTRLPMVTSTLLTPLPGASGQPDFLALGLEDGRILAGLLRSSAGGLMVSDFVLSKRLLQEPVFAMAFSTDPGAPGRSGILSLAGVDSAVVCLPVGLSACGERLTLSERAISTPLPSGGVAALASLELPPRRPSTGRAANGVCLGVASWDGCLRLLRVHAGHFTCRPVEGSPGLPPAPPCLLPLAELRMEPEQPQQSPLSCLSLSAWSAPASLASPGPSDFGLEIPLPGSLRGPGAPGSHSAPGGRIRAVAGARNGTLGIWRVC